MFKLYAGIAAILALVGIIYAVHQYGYNAGQEKVKADWAKSVIESAELARKELERKQAESDARRQKDNEEREQKERAERKRLEEDRKKAEATAANLYKRYQDALLNKQSCAEQMKQVLACPVR
jgi:hypothetical protein